MKNPPVRRILYRIQGDLLSYDARIRKCALEGPLLVLPGSHAVKPFEFPAQVELIAEAAALSYPGQRLILQQKDPGRLLAVWQK